MLPYATAAEAEAALGRAMTWAETLWFRYSAATPDYCLYCHHIVIFLVVYTLAPLPLALLELWAPAVLSQYKLQPRVWLSTRAFLRCYVDTVRVFLVAMGPVQFLSYPAVKMAGIRTGLPLPSAGETAAQIVVFLLVEDYLGYWMHRLLHTRWGYEVIHRIHHEFTAPIGYAGPYGHWADVLILGFPAFAGPAIVACHMTTFWLWFVIRQLAAMDAHNGFDFPLNPIKFIPFYGGAPHHDYHHRVGGKSQSNFASIFTFCDYLYGTDKGYRYHKASLAKPRELGAGQHGRTCRLPSELLGVILSRLPSLADRVRLRAACRQWRSSAATILHQSPLPWLAFSDGTLLDVYNSTAHRVRLRDDGATCYCAGENMLFLFHADGRCSLMNTFSSDVTLLPELAALLKSRGVKSSRIMKVVMSSAPRLVAVLFHCILGYSFIAFTSYGPAGEINSSRALKVDHRWIDMIIDIAIFQGKIHAISKDNKLLALQLSNDDKQTPRLRWIVGGASLPSTASSHGIYEVWRYLVESNGRLLMVSRWVSNDRLSEYVGRTRKLLVMEADLSHGLWNNVDDLEGHTLFVSRQCSRSIIPAAADAGGDTSLQDCIYFLDDLDRPDKSVNTMEGGLGDCGAYNIRHGTITPLVPEQPATPLPWINKQTSYPEWFFPVEV